MVFTILYDCTLSDTNCTISSINSTDKPATTSSALITSNVTTNDQDINGKAGPATSQPDQTLTPDNTGLIAAVISVIIVLVGTVIMLVVIMLLVKKRYSNVTRKPSLSHSTLKIIFYSCTENSMVQNSMHMKWSAGCETRIQN